MPPCTPGSSPPGFRSPSQAPEGWVAQGSVKEIPLGPIPSRRGVSIEDIVGLELKQGVGRKPN